MAFAREWDHVLVISTATQFPIDLRAFETRPNRFDWLIRLRWGATFGIMAGAFAAYMGVVPGACWEVLVAIGFGGLAYNTYLAIEVMRGTPSTGVRDPITQSLIDIAVLTGVLYAAGGTDCPFVGFYVFHVAIVGFLARGRGILRSAGAAIVSVILLGLVHFMPELAIGRWDPIAPVDELAPVVAFLSMIVGVAYLVSKANREVYIREQQLHEARALATLEQEILKRTLDEVSAGLELLGPEGVVTFQNRAAQDISTTKVGERWSAPSKRVVDRDDLDGLVGGAIEKGESMRQRLAIRDKSGERVFELLVFPLPGGKGDAPRAMTLYIDRTEATLKQSQLMLAERLASLGRVAQGVAHDFNTPLATIRTLATDIRATLAELEGAPEEVVSDIDESVTLIRDETGRLGRITQALLAGGDLVRTQIDGEVPLHAVVERARALVFAGVRSGTTVSVGDGISKLTVQADPDRLMQVLVNLLQNAQDAVREVEGGALEINADVTTDDGMVELVVLDNGHGIKDEIEAQLFEPFATTKPVGQGTGLGLYNSYMLAQAMGGDLSLTNRNDGPGARAVLSLPAGPTADTVLAHVHQAGKGA